MAAKVTAVRFSDELRARIAQAAEESGQSVSAWLAQAAEERLVRPVIDSQGAHVHKPPRRPPEAEQRQTPTRPPRSAPTAPERPTAANCPHPVSRRIGTSCAACGATVAAKKK